MIPRRLRLARGTQPRNAANTLGELITDGRNIVASVAGGHRVIRLRDKYIDWVERAELQLSNFTLQPDALEMFQTPRYWHIREIHERSPRPEPLIRAEIEGQTAALERLVDDLEARVKQLSLAPGHITVLDTNALLEYQPPGQIEWGRA